MANHADPDQLVNWSQLIWIYTVTSDQPWWSWYFVFILVDYQTGFKEKVFSHWRLRSQSSCTSCTVSIVWLVVVREAWYHWGDTVKGHHHIGTPSHHDDIAEKLLTITPVCKNILGKKEREKRKTKNRTTHLLSAIICSSCLLNPSWVYLLRLSAPVNTLIARFTRSSFMKKLMSFFMFKTHLSSASQHILSLDFNSLIQTMSFACMKMSLWISYLWAFWLPG